MIYKIEFCKYAANVKNKNETAKFNLLIINYLSF